MNRFQSNSLLALAAFAVLGATTAVAEPAYTVERIEPPLNASLEVGGIEFSVDGKLMMCTRRGDVWAYEPESKEWTQFARGLQEALGLRVGKKGEVFVLQRCELTRVFSVPVGHEEARQVTRFDGSPTS